MVDPALPAAKNLFFAYASMPNELGTTIEAAAARAKARPGDPTVVPWPELPIAGRFIGSTVITTISTADVLVADVTTLNFNVTYELGYAIGSGKPVFLVRHAAFPNDVNLTTEVGIFDTLGYRQYQNTDQLSALLAEAQGATPLLTALPADMKAPVYLLEGKYKTDWAIRIVSRIKKARLSFRSFDPVEQSRLSAHEAIRQVAQSYGVLVYLMPTAYEDAMVHNQRAAFVAGLAHGMGKVLAFLQFGDDPVPLDYRDLVTSFKHPTQSDEAIAEFAARVAEALQGGFPAPTHAPVSRLAQLTFGASTAENEMRSLVQYYLETDPFVRAMRGEIRIVVGRKGSGKTALFIRLRDATRADREKVVLDLKPDGYQLVKFKEAVLDLLSLGTIEHTITAFWEYLLLLELCHKLLEKDRGRHVRDHHLYAAYRRLADTFGDDQYIGEGDFSERMTRLLQVIQEEYHARYSGIKPARLSDPEITSLLYRHNVKELLTAAVDYLRLKSSVWLLFDNVDKGWPAHGIKPEDILIIRSLIEATRKVERHIQNRGIDGHTVVFLRNDIYELLVDQTPDRGKETRAVLDWTDPDMLRELIRRRLASAFSEPTASFDPLWRLVFVSHIDGEETSQYLIDRCLMRPRWLLDLISHCRGFAVNLGHERVEQDDIRKALNVYSTDLLADLSFEVRDVFPDLENLLYAFMEAPPQMTEDDVIGRLSGNVGGKDPAECVTVLLWYGFLGVVRSQDDVSFIHSAGINYNMQILRAILKKLRANRQVQYAINPAFWPCLSVSAS